MFSRSSKICLVMGIALGCSLALFISTSLFVQVSFRAMTAYGTDNTTAIRNEGSSSDGATKSIDKLVDTELMDTIQAERKATLNEACKRIYTDNICSSNKKTMNHKLLYSKNYKLISCDIQKCGYSSWLKAFYAIEGKVDDFYSFQKQGLAIARSAQFRMTSLKKMAVRQKAFDESLKVILIRHPFNRLVSAFHDRLTPTSRGYSGGLYRSVSRNINSNHRHLRHNVSERNRTDDGSATFEDFVNFLVRTKSLDVHWKTFRDHCHPCTSQYDYIAKFETLDNDMDYLKRKINLTEEHRKYFFPKDAFQTNSDLVKKTFESIPRELIYRLYEVYREDFEVFGYKMPEWMCS